MTAVNPFATPPPAPPPAAPPPVAAAPPSAPPPAANPFAAAPPPATAPPPAAAAPPPPPAAPPTPPQAPPPAAAPPTSLGQAPPGAPSLPGMQTPGARSPGAGAGKLSLTLVPSVIVRGTFQIRPKRFLQTAKMQNPSIVFEVYDDGELEKAKRQQPNVQGAEIMITLWNDGSGRAQQMFRDMGYPDNTWTELPGGGHEMPINQLINVDKPLLLAEIDQKEGSTPGRLFPTLKILKLLKQRTT